MKTIVLKKIVLATLVLTVAAQVQARDSGADAASVFAVEKQSHVEELKETLVKSEYAAHTLAEITGMAVNPLFAAAALGAYRYCTAPAEARNGLPWFYKPGFWIICLVLAGSVLIFSLFSDIINLPPTIAAILELCNKNIGLALTSPIVFNAASKLADNMYAAEPANGLTYLCASFIPLDLFSVMPLSGVPQTLWYMSIVPMLFFTFFAMWLLNLTFDVFILLCPFGFIDLCLKIARGIFLAALMAIAVLFPQLIFILVIPIMLVSVILFGWSFRRVIMAFVFSWDFLFKRGGGGAPVSEKGIVAFSGRGTNIPSKTFGRLTEKDGALRFSYRKFLFFPKTITLNNSNLVLTCGFLYSKLCDDGTAAYILPPRYQKKIEEIQSYLTIHRFECSVLKKGFKGIVKWLKKDEDEYLAVT